MGLAHDWLQRTWYQGTALGALLLPLSGLYAVVTGVRRLAYQRGWKRTESVTKPVIVVGNISVGGTGKTPTVIWLVERLRSLGYAPGIVSRGYGGSHSGTSMRVDAASDPRVVGDEPVLLARRAQCPVVVDADRVRAAQMLIDDGVDAVIADDGLQHWRFGRDMELCIVDGARGLGNGRLLPAGPLRETADRLESVDAVLVNGQGFDTSGCLRFELRSDRAERLNGSMVRPLKNFAATTVHAVAAIGNPSRFFDMLREYGIQVIEHPYPDHSRLDLDTLNFADNFDVLMTEKDAVKLPATVADRFWSVPVDVEMTDEDAGKLTQRVQRCIDRGSVHE